MRFKNNNDKNPANPITIKSNNLEGINVNNENTTKNIFEYEYIEIIPIQVLKLIANLNIQKNTIKSIGTIKANPNTIVKALLTTL